MKLLLSGVTGALICMPVFGDVITYDDLEYQTVDWFGSPELDSSAVGSVGDIGVTFSSVSIAGGEPIVYDFSIGPPFDALTFETGLSETITLFGGLEGLSSVAFSQEVGPVLILIGATDGSAGPSHFGASVWDFDDELEMVAVDGEGDGFFIDEGNIVSNPNWGPEGQICGVIGIFNEGIGLLEWMQSTQNGLDEMQITFAVAIPAPACGLALLLPAALCARRRR